MSRSLEEVIAGFRGMSSTLGLTPNGPLAPQTPAFPNSPALSLTSLNPVSLPSQPSPLEASTAIGRGGYLPPAYVTSPMVPQVNYAGNAQTRQSFQVANALGQMGPPAAYMTDPAYGGFRPPPAPAVPMGTGMLPSPLLPYPQFASPSFTSPTDFNTQHANLVQRQSEMHHMAMLQSGGRLGMGAAMGFAGSSLGMFMGGAMGGSAGMRAGGAIGGVMGAGFGAFGPGAALSDSITSWPLHTDLRTIQMQEASQRFFTSGQTMGPGGTGLGMQDSGRVVHALSSFADKSKGLFNRKDMMNITQAAGDSGLLDFANNSDAIIKQVKLVAKIAASVAQITNDPDMRANIQLLGSLQRMGSSTEESFRMLRSLRSSGRAAGVNVGAFMQNEGAAGAAMFQGQGLMGSVGAGAMLYGAGAARNMMSTGAISTTLSGLLGGPSGISQNYAQATAGFANGPLQMLVGSVIKKDAQGNISLDREKMDALVGGKPFNWKDVHQQTINNLGGDPNTIGKFQTQRGELTADMMKYYTPQQLAMVQINSVRATQEQYGGEKNMSFAAAATRGGYSNEHARMLEAMANSRGFWENQRRQMAQDAHQQARDDAEGIMGGDSTIPGRVKTWWRDQHFDYASSAKYRAQNRRAEQDEDAYEDLTGRRRGISKIMSREDSREWLQMSLESNDKERGVMGPDGFVVNRAHKTLRNIGERMGTFNPTYRSLNYAQGGLWEMGQYLMNAGDVAIPGSASLVGGALNAMLPGGGSFDTAARLADARQSVDDMSRGLSLSVKQDDAAHGKIRALHDEDTTAKIHTAMATAARRHFDTVMGADGVTAHNDMMDAGRAELKRRGVDTTKILDSTLAMALPGGISRTAASNPYLARNILSTKTKTEEALGDESSANMDEWKRSGDEVGEKVISDFRGVGQADGMLGVDSTTFDRNKEIAKLLTAVYKRILKLVKSNTKEADAFWRDLLLVAGESVAGNEAVADAFNTDKGKIRRRVVESFLQSCTQEEQKALRTLGTVNGASTPSAYADAFKKNEALGSNMREVAVKMVRQERRKAMLALVGVDDKNNALSDNEDATMESLLKSDKTSEEVRLAIGEFKAARLSGDAEAETSARKRIYMDPSFDDAEGVLTGKKATAGNPADRAGLVAMDRYIVDAAKYLKSSADDLNTGTAAFRKFADDLAHSDLGQRIAAAAGAVGARK